MKNNLLKYIPAKSILPILLMSCLLGACTATTGGGKPGYHSPHSGYHNNY